MAVARESLQRLDRKRQDLEETKNRSKRLCGGLLHLGLGQLQPGFGQQATVRLLVLPQVLAASDQATDTLRKELSVGLR